MFFFKNSTHWTLLTQIYWVWSCQESFPRNQGCFSIGQRKGAQKRLYFSMIETFNLIKFNLSYHLLLFFFYKRSRLPLLLVHVIVSCKVNRVSISEPCRKWISWTQAYLSNSSRVEVINWKNITCFCCTSHFRSSSTSKSKVKAKDELSLVPWLTTDLYLSNEITRFFEIHAHHSQFSQRIQNAGEPRRWGKSL